MRRTLAFATLALLLPGCLVEDDGRDRDDEVGDDDGWDLGDVAEFEGRTKATLGQRTVGTPGPAASFPFQVSVPQGGALAVEWRLQITGANVDTYVEGPHCARQGLQVGGIGGGSSTITGTCDDLPAGTYEFEVVHTAGAIVDIKAEVTGHIVADR